MLSLQSATQTDSDHRLTFMDFIILPFKHFKGGDIRSEREIIKERHMQTLGDRQKVYITHANRHIHPRRHTGLGEGAD